MTNWMMWFRQPIQIMSCRYLSMAFMFLAVSLTKPSVWREVQLKHMCNMQKSQTGGCRRCRNRRHKSNLKIRSRMSRTMRTRKRSRRNEITLCRTPQSSSVDSKFGAKNSALCFFSNFLQPSTSLILLQLCI